MEIGSRVGAIMGSKGNKVKIFGYGVYAGDFVPPANIGGFGKILNEIGRENPRIDLDNGKSVYGCECWWGSEDKIKEKFKNMEFIEVNIDEERLRAED